MFSNVKKATNRLVIDIGANIISLEPLSEAYVKLWESAKQDSTGSSIHKVR